MSLGPHIASHFPHCDVSCSLWVVTRGQAGDEVEDMGYNIANARRRSNSSTNPIRDFKTKFETIEPEPVFEEELHGPIGAELDKESTTSSSNTVEEEDASKKF